MKVVVRANDPHINTSQLLEEIEIFDQAVPVLNLLIVAPDGPDTRLIALSADAVKSIPVQTCHHIDACDACSLMSTPYCAWDVEIRACVAHQSQTNKTMLVNKQEHC